MIKNVLICGSGELCSELLKKAVIGSVSKVNVLAILEFNEHLFGTTSTGETIEPVDTMRNVEWDYLVLTSDGSEYRDYAINAGVNPAKILDYGSSKELCVDVLGLDIDLLPALHSDEEIEYLAKRVMAVPVGGVIVEVGTWAGGSAAFMQHFAKDGVEIYSVDICSCDYARKQWGHLPSVRFIKSDSVSASKEFLLSVDLLFIDGGHELHNIYMDFSAWSKKLKRGGYVIFHDYAPDETGGVHYPGVKLYLDTLIDSKKLSNVQKITSMISGQLCEPFDITLDELKQHYRQFISNVLGLRDDLEPHIEQWLKNTSECLDLHNIVYDNGPFEHNYTAKFNLLALCYLMHKLMFKGVYDLDVSGECAQASPLPQKEMIFEHLIFIDVHRRRDCIDICDNLLSGDLIFPESTSQLDSISSLFDFSRFLTFEKQRLMPLLQSAEALFSKINHNILEQKNRKIYIEKLTKVVKSIINSHATGTVALYGAQGELADDALKILATHSFENVIFVDKAIAGSVVNGVNVYAFDDLGKHVDFPDAIVISAKFSGPEIHSFLGQSSVTSAIYPIYDLDGSYINNLIN